MENLETYHYRFEQKNTSVLNDTFDNFKQLLERNPDGINNVKRATTFLYGACAGGYLAYVELLLSYENVDVNKICENGNHAGKTPLFIACENNHYDVVYMLLQDERVDINKPNKYMITPLMISIVMKSKNIIPLLLKDTRTNINLKSNSYGSAVDLLCEQNRIANLQLLLQLDNVHIDYITFFKCCYKDRLIIFKILIEHLGTTVDDLINKYPDLFYVACTNNAVDIVKYILDNVDININRLYGNDYQEEDEDEDDEDEDEDEDEDDGKETLLHSACRSGLIELIKLLLNHDQIDIHTLNSNGHSALYEAYIVDKQSNVINLLINSKKFDRDEFFKEIHDDLKKFAKS